MRGVIFFFVTQSFVLAAPDELILNGNRLSPQTIGDFQITSGRSEKASFVIENLIDSKGQVRTGELWDFFRSQGIESLDRLTLVIDVDDHLTSNQDFMMDSMTLTIADPDAGLGGEKITEANMNRDGENLLVLKKSDFPNIEPKARMEFELGYDFMQRFQSSSKETVLFHFHTRSGMIDSAAFEYNQLETPAPLSHMLSIILFILFWTVVFFLMYLFLSPKKIQQKDPAVQKSAT
ncbi:MAG: hypothetical protein MK106_07630 [Mariniblastus sp.]|nr:hypothetical protein [Mariniblastus sp.]